MAKVNANYEVVYIMDPALGEEAIAAMIEKFKTLVETQGTVAAIDDWGKRRLAYPINDLNEGHYVLMTFTAAKLFTVAGPVLVYGISASVLYGLILWLIQVL